jgi:hypothetical protein
MLREGGRDRIGRGYLLALGRAPRPAERAALDRLLGRLRARFDADPTAAAALLAQGAAPRDTAFAPAELAAYTGLASALINLDEAVTKE